METTPQEQPGRIEQILKTAVRPVDILSFYVMVGCMTVMAIVVCAQVILRYFFSYSIDWADEVARLMFVWSMFLAIPHGVKLGSHVGIDALSRFLSEKYRSLLARLIQLLCAILCIVVVYMGIFVAGEKWDELMPTIDITASMYYIPVIFAMLHSCIHFLIFVICGSGPEIWKRN